MKTLFTLLSLFSLAGFLFFIGCASENEQGGSADSMESSQGKYTSPHNRYEGPGRDDYWARDYKY